MEIQFVSEEDAVYFIIEDNGVKYQKVIYILKKDSETNRSPHYLARDEQESVQEFEYFPDWLQKEM
jgi:hypothetical protein